MKQKEFISLKLLNIHETREALRSIMLIFDLLLVGGGGGGQKHAKK